MSKISFVFVLATLVVFSAAAFQWEPPSVVHGYFGRADASGYLLRGILRESREDFILFSSEAIPVFQANSDAPNGIFSGDLLVEEHPRGYRTVQLLLTTGHYTGVLDTQQTRWINPELLLPLQSSSTANIRTVMVGSGMDAIPLPWAEFHIGIPAAEAGRNALRPVRDLEIWLDEEKLVSVDYILADIDSSDHTLFSHANGLYRIESDMLRSGRELQFRLRAPDGRLVERSLVLP